METLDCGHSNDWSNGTGSRDSAGRSLCRRCAHERAVSAMHGARWFFAYLDENDRHITDWSGLRLADRVGGIKRHHAKTPRELLTFHAVDVHGQHWACRQWPNAGTYVRMIRVKGP